MYHSIVSVGNPDCSSVLLILEYWQGSSEGNSEMSNLKFRLAVVQVVDLKSKNTFLVYAYTVT